MVARFNKLIRIVMLPVCAVLTGCAGADVPRWVTGEPTAQDLAYDGPIRMQADAPEAWPNLADVPLRRTPSLTREEQVKAVEELRQQNEKGLNEIAAFNAHVASTMPALQKNKTVNRKSRSQAP